VRTKSTSNNLTIAQQAAVSGGADLYNALGGGDTITLPNANPSDTSVPLAGTSLPGVAVVPVPFDLTHVLMWAIGLVIRPSISGGNGSYNIALGAGIDTVTINGVGTTNVAAGTGTDNFSISGGPLGGVGKVGTLVVNGNLSGGSATIGANSIFELNVLIAARSRLPELTNTEDRWDFGANWNDKRVWTGRQF